MSGGSRPRFEIRGKYGAYGAVFVKNEKDIFYNRAQGYMRRSDAIHSIELLYGGEVESPNVTTTYFVRFPLMIWAGSYGWVEIRDCTTRRQKGQS